MGRRRGVGVWDGGSSPESSFHLCNVVYRHANAVAVHPQTAAAHLLTPFLAPQLTHFSHTPLGRNPPFFFPPPSSLAHFTLLCRCGQLQQCTFVLTSSCLWPFPVTAFHWWRGAGCKTAIAPMAGRFLIN